MLYLLACFRAVSHLSRQIFLALDPISAMHMGLTNNPDEQYRAELLSHFILRKIPNSIVDDPRAEEADIFAQKRESQKYEQTKSKRLAQEAEKSSAHADDVLAFNAATSAQAVTSKTELWKATKVADADGMDVVDLEGSAVPFASRAKPASAHAASEQRQQPHAQSLSGRSLSSGKLPPLREMFADADKYWFRSVDVTLAESAEVYAALCANGCKTAEELVAYLDDHKELRSCTCSADMSTAAHASHCHTRQAGAWTGALRTAGVTVFTARKIVLRLESHLK
jgi:arylsulfatase A-like enzyme